MSYGREPQDEFGKKTSSEGNYVITDRKKVDYTVGAGRDGTQRRTKTINIYSWQPKQPAAAAAPDPEAQAAPQTTSPVIDNQYQSEIDTRESTLNTAPTRPNNTFFNNWVNGADTTQAGIGSIERARAGTKTDGTTMPGRTYQQIYDASKLQNFQFQPDALDYLIGKIGEQQNTDSQSKIDALRQEQSDYLNNLRIEQDTRLNSMAAEQTKRADELAIGQRTYQQNQSRSGMLGSLQIGGAAETPRTGGTQGFKRRNLQINPVTANALAGILGGTASATTTNTLNV